MEGSFAFNAHCTRLRTLPGDLFAEIKSDTAGWPTERAAEAETALQGAPEIPTIDQTVRETLVHLPRLYK